MVNISLAKIAKRGIKRNRSRGMMTCHLTRPVGTRQEPRNGWDLYRTRQKHPHACPIRSCCPHSLGWSCLPTLVLTLTLITCRCVPFSYEDIYFWCKFATCPVPKYFTRVTLCVRSCIKSGVLYVLAWSELVKGLQNISHGSNLFAKCYLSIQARFDVFVVTNIFSGNFTTNYPTFQ